MVNGLSLPLVSALIFSASMFPYALTDRATYDGLASDRRSGTLVYAEEHVETLSSGKRVGLETTYVDARGNAIARRTVDFRSNILVPDFMTEDLRDGYLEGAEIRGDSVRLFTRKNRSEDLREKVLVIPHPAVVDAGFNNFVQDNWESIERGEKQYFNFGVPFALDYYGFRVYKEEELVQDGRRLMVVHLDIDNFVIRLFLDPIVLTYDMESRRLRFYEGISNINNERGKSHNVRIAYDPYGP